MSWTQRSKSSNYAVGPGGNTLTLQLTNIGTADLIVLFVTHEAAKTDTISVSDGISSLSDGGAGKLVHVLSNTEPSAQMFYLLSSIATGTVTYTVTWSTTTSVERNIMAMAHTPSGTAAQDGTAVALSGTDTAPTSGNMTTTGTDGISFGGYATYGQTLTSPLINGAAASDTQGTTSKSLLWVKTYSSGFTGAATGTLGASERWVNHIISFNNTAGGGGGGSSGNSKLVKTFVSLAGLAAPFLKSASGLYLRDNSIVRPELKVAA